MFSAVVVDIKSNILVLEGEASGCEVRTGLSVVLIKL